MNKEQLSEYEKMPSSFKDLIADEAIFKQLNKLDWVATEKIHGANFRFIYHDRKLGFGKRKEMLTWEDDFFGFQIAAARLETQVIELFEQVSQDFKTKEVVLYGELFGGTYPHPEVAPNPDVNAVQTGIFYSPNIEFCAYDIAIKDPVSKSKTYLSYQAAIGYFQKFGLFYAKPLKTGKLSDLLQFDLKIESIIPNAFDLPPLQDNFIEGIVIKPFKDCNPDLLGCRPILKIKNPEFEENEKYHQAQKWSFKPNATSFSEDLNFLLTDIRNYITKNRLNSAISKIGSITTEERKKLIEKEFLEDVLADFDLDNNFILRELTEPQIEWITERVKAEIFGLVNTTDLSATASK